MANDMPFHKVVLVGEAAVGKTSIRRNFMGKSFTTQYISTIGTELSYYESDRMSLSIWDLAGEPGFKSVRRTFYMGAVGVIAVYDVTRPETLPALDSWIAEFREVLRPNVAVILAGNKIDLDDVGDTSAFIQRHREEGLNINETVMPTSAKTGVNIPQLFDLLGDMIDTIVG
ncbi:MAG: Rab family GTPase [Candidatus Kariarchaeaceae archaeon]|jgi:small GTP-binding protein